MRIVPITTARPRIPGDSTRRSLAFGCLVAVLLLGGCGPSVATGPSASPKATRSPIPTRADGMRRFTGKIADGKTGAPVSDVCVIIGPPVDCGENMPHSDDKGVWFADLPVAGGTLLWTFNFVKDGYVTFVVKEASSAPGEEQLDVTLQPK